MTNCTKYYKYIPLILLVYSNICIRDTKVIRALQSVLTVVLRIGDSYYLLLLKLKHGNSFIISKLD